MIVRRRFVRANYCHNEHTYTQTYTRACTHTHHKQAAIVDVRRMLVRSRDMRDLQTDRTETAFSERVGRNLHASGDALIRRTSASASVRTRAASAVRCTAAVWRRGWRRRRRRWAIHRPAYRGYCSTRARYRCVHRVTPPRNLERSACLRQRRIHNETMCEK